MASSFDQAFGIHRHAVPVTTDDMYFNVSSAASHANTQFRDALPAIGNGNSCTVGDKQGEI